MRNNPNFLGSGPNAATSCLAAGSMAIGACLAAQQVPRDVNAIKDIYNTLSNEQPAGESMQASVRGAAAAAIRLYDKARQPDSGIEYSTGDFEGSHNVQMRVELNGGNFSLVWFKYSGARPTPTDLTMLDERIMLADKTFGGEIIFNQAPSGPAVSPGWTELGMFYRPDRDSRADGTLTTVTVSGNLACAATQKVQNNLSSEPSNRCERKITGPQAADIQRILADDLKRLAGLPTGGDTPVFHAPVLNS
jgi:hypothetical protein